MKIFSYTFLFLILLLNYLSANDKESNFYFIENKGQWNNEVRYLFKSVNYYAWITDFGVVFDYFENEMDDYVGNVIKMKFNNTNAIINFQSKNESNTYYNYFIGDDWAINVRKYEEVIVKNIYKGIDIRYYADKQTKNLRYDFEISPFANPNDINFTIEGANYITNNDGELELIINNKSYKHTNLFAYQNIENDVNKIECRFDLTCLNTEMPKQVRHDRANLLVVEITHPM